MRAFCQAPKDKSSLTRKQRSTKLPTRFTKHVSTPVWQESRPERIPRLSTYTEACWKIDLHNLLYFLRLRTAPRAQEEIRTFARAIGHEIVSKWVPFASEAFLDYQYEDTHHSGIEREALKNIMTGSLSSGRAIAQSKGLLKPGENEGPS